MSDVDRSTERSIRSRQTIRMVLWVVIAAVIALLAFLNTQSVTVDWLVGDADTSLWLVIAATAFLGFLAGFVTHSRRQ